MDPTREDVLALFDFAWARLRHRLIGLNDAEWLWQPTGDVRVGLRWRLQHLAELLRDNRNANGLGRAPTARVPDPARDATDAIAQLEAAYAEWRSHLCAVGDVTLTQPVGSAAGPRADRTRLALALHIADELIHHGAEAALLRDLHATARTTASTRVQ